MSNLKKIYNKKSNFYNYFIELKREKGSQWRSALGFSTSYASKLSFAPRDNLNFSILTNLK